MLPIMKRWGLVAVLLFAALSPLVPITSAEAADAPIFQGVFQQFSTFYPTVKDDFRDTTQVHFGTDVALDSETWTVTDSAGAVVKSVDVGPGPAYYDNTVEWDGRTDTGAMAKPGTYRIDITVQRTAIGTMEGDNLIFTLSRYVTLASDVVTRHVHVTWVPGSTGSGYWDSKSTTGRCRAIKLPHSAYLDCWGRGSAKASYSFWLPTTGEEPGAGPVRNLHLYFTGVKHCCQPGKVIKKITHPHKHIWKGVVTVTDWRAYQIDSFNATYSYLKRR
jgi:hypothetical protein